MGKAAIENNLYTGSISSPVEAESANDLVNPDDVIAPVSGSVERLGAAYRIKATLPYDESTNLQPTRATDFYGQISQSRS